MHRQESGEDVCHDAHENDVKEEAYMCDAGKVANPKELNP